MSFDSVMYDGAHLPFEENIATTRRVVEIAHAFRVPVEAELGKVPDADEAVDRSSYYTDVTEAERFVAETGVDTLAISVGVVHGVPMSEPSPLAIERVAEIRRVVPVPLVLHGAPACRRTRSELPWRTVCTSSTPTPTCARPSAAGSRRRGRRATVSWRRRWRGAAS